MGSEILGYYIYRSLDSLNWTMAGTSESVSYVDQGLVNDMTYYYMVRAPNAIGQGDASHSWSIRPNFAPSDFMASPSELMDRVATELTFSWTPQTQKMPGVTRYRIHRDASGVADVDKSLTQAKTAGGGGSYRLCGLCEDGTESCAEPIFIGMPMCEGARSGYDLFLAYAMVGILVAFLALLLPNSRKRK